MCGVCVVWYLWGGQGKFFGEIALLEPGHVRSATIRTVTFCELRCLSAATFDVITNR